MVFLNTLSVAAEAPLDAGAEDSMATTGFTQTAIKLSPVFSPAVRECGDCVGHGDACTARPTCT
jgi:hypothetical protein